MKGPVIFAWFLSLLIAGLNSASAQNELVYVKSGGAINLKPESSGPFTSILWKHKDNLVAEWVNNEMDYYGMFVGRTTLDTATGHLEIRNMSEAFAGLYTVELSSRVQRKGYMVEFIAEVPKPEVGVKPLVCSSEFETCTLACLHDESSGVGPLTYSWREDGGEWEEGDKNKIIKNDEKNQGVKTFSCQVKNPVSEAESEASDNPFYKINQSAEQFSTWPLL